MLIGNLVLKLKRNSSCYINIGGSQNTHQPSEFDYCASGLCLLVLNLLPYEAQKVNRLVLLTALASVWLVLLIARAY
jgi:hypothetical protein